MARTSRVLFIICAHLYLAAATVPVRKLNDGSKDMPAIALGTMLGHDSKGNRLQPKGNEMEQAVLWALEAGYRHIDTALNYGIEDQVGRAVNKKGAEGIKREDIYVTSKLFNDAHAKEDVLPTLRTTLKNLNLDYVDLYLIHWPISQYKNGTYYFTDYVETWQAMIEAKSLGLAKSIGVSNFNKEQIGRLLEHGLQKPSVLQVEMNLNLQQPELLAYCKEQDIVVTGYTPFGSLFPSKAAADAPPPRVDEPALVEIAAKYNKTVPQVALRYLIELGAVPLPKSITKSRIESNLQVFDFELTSAERELLKGYDKNYRTLPQEKWSDHPYYPFEKKKKE